MTILNPTVQFERLPEYDAFKMTWHAPADEAEVGQAVNSLMDVLEHSAYPTSIVVELGGNARLRRVSTTLLLPCLHPMLAEMVVYGGDSTVRTIGRTLALLTGRANVRGFDTADAAFEHLLTRANR